LRLRGFLYIGTTACVFGLGVVLAKLITSVLNSFLISFLALFGGGILIAIYLLIKRQALLPPLSWSAWSNMLLLASFGTALPLLLVIAGFARTSAIIGGVLLQGQGPAAVLFAALWLHERLTWQQVIGTSLILIGSVLVVLQIGQAQVWQSGGVGALLVLIGALGYGYSLIPAKRLVGQADVLQLSFLRLLLGAFFVLPLLFFQSSLIQGTVSWPIIWTLVLYIVTSYCVGYITQQAGLRFLKAWEASAVLQTLPLFTAFFALVLLHETPTLLQAGGGILVIIGGVIVVSGKSTPEKNQQENSSKL
jgi:drug/metabolite transporter (DMT)-like permease